MKVLQFTIPVSHHTAIIVQEDNMPHFYPYLHRHREAQLIWIKQGEGTLLVDNQMHMFQKDDIFFIGANQPHLFKSNPEYFVANSELSINSLMIFFDPNGKIAPFLALPEMQLIQNFLIGNQKGFKFSKDKCGVIAQKMIDVQKVKNQNLIIQFIQLINGLMELQHEFVPLTTYSSVLFTESEGIRISNVFNYLMQNFDKNINLCDVATQAHMTPQAFCRYFKKRTRQTFVSFLNEIRINEACKQLADGSYENISFIAYSCGFNSLTNFNRVFKGIKGFSPKTYIDLYFSNIKH